MTKAAVAEKVLESREITKDDFLKLYENEEDKMSSLGEDQHADRSALIFKLSTHAPKFDEAYTQFKTTLVKVHLPDDVDAIRYTFRGW